MPDRSPLLGNPRNNNQDAFEEFLDTFKIPMPVQCCGCLLIFALFCMTTVLQSLDPNEFGILQNSITGTLEEGPAVRGGESRGGRSWKKEAGGSLGEGGGTLGFRRTSKRV